MLGFPQTSFHQLPKNSVPLHHSGIFIWRTIVLCGVDKTQKRGAGCRVLLSSKVTLSLLYTLHIPLHLLRITSHICVLAWLLCENQCPCSMYCPCSVHDSASSLSHLYIPSLFVSYVGHNKQFTVCSPSQVSLLRYSFQFTDLYTYLSAYVLFSVQ